MTDYPLVVENLSFRYHSRPELAICAVSFQLEPGELLLVAGSSGCGKTTLARCINGLVPRSYKGELTGSVLLHGRPVSQMPLVEISQVIGTSASMLCSPVGAGQCRCSRTPPPY